MWKEIGHRVHEEGGSNATVLTQMTQVAAFELTCGGGKYEGTSAVLSKGLAGIGQVLRKFFPAK